MKNIEKAASKDLAPEKIAAVMHKDLEALSHEILNPKTKKEILEAKLENKTDINEVAETKVSNLEKSNEDKNEDKSEPTKVKGWRTLTPEQKIIADSQMDAKQADKLIQKITEEIGTRFGDSALNTFSPELFS